MKHLPKEDAKVKFSKNKYLFLCKICSKLLVRQSFAKLARTEGKPKNDVTFEFAAIISYDWQIESF